MQNDKRQTQLDEDNNLEHITNEAHSKLLSFFIEEIKDIYGAEKQLVETLPKLQQAATHNELQQVFAHHLQQTNDHVCRLEQIFEIVQEKVQAKKCEAMEGLVKEAMSIIKDTGMGSSTRDVGLVMAGQKTAHYEIATYGSLVQLADMLEMDRVVDILKITLDEEKQADKKLTALAEQTINRMSLEEIET